MNQLTSTEQRPHDEADQSAYERDFALWIEAQVDILRAKKFELLDLDNVIEEFESMGGNQRRELASRIEVLLMQLLKCRYQPEKKTGSWVATIHEQRSEIHHLLASSPSLRPHVDALAEVSYAAAVRRATAETGLPGSSFPRQLLNQTEDLIDVEFIP